MMSMSRRMTVSAEISPSIHHKPMTNVATATIRAISPHSSAINTSSALSNSSRAARHSAIPRSTSAC